MKNIINSPIFITFVAFLALFILQNRSQNRIASEIKAAYEQILYIMNDAISDIEKTKALQTFAQKISTQLKTGFQIGFSSGESSKKISPEKQFLDIKDKVEFSKVQLSSPDQSNRQEILYTVKNLSDLPIRQLRVNFEYFRGGELIDAENNWISEVKVLAPGESFSSKQNRHPPRNVPENEIPTAIADSVKLKATSFDIVD